MDANLTNIVLFSFFITSVKQFYYEKTAFRKKFVLKAFFKKMFTFIIKKIFFLKKQIEPSRSLRIIMLDKSK